MTVENGLQGFDKRDYIFINLWSPRESAWGILKFVKSLWILLLSVLEIFKILQF